MKKKEIIEQLARENEQLRKEMGILVEKPDSPEAAVIITQWFFAQEVSKQFETGEPADVPKLMGLVGKMMYPAQKESAMEEEAKSGSILPMIIEDDGVVMETIICDSISGGKRYLNDMPMELSLIRTMEDGREYRAKYKQDEG